MDKIFKTLEDFKDLPENWDSYGAKQISEKTINEVKLILGYLPVKWDWEVFPCPCGGVQIECSSSNGFDIEVYISEHE